MGSPLSTLPIARRRADCLTKYLVMGSGGLVLIMMAVIFIYLLLMVLPIFKQASLSSSAAFVLPQTPNAILYPASEPNWLLQWQPKGKFRALPIPEAGTQFDLDNVSTAQGLPSDVLLVQPSATQPDDFLLQTPQGWVFGQWRFEGNRPQWIAPLGVTPFRLPFQPSAMGGFSSTENALTVVANTETGARWWHWQKGQPPQVGRLPDAPKNVSQWLWSKNGEQLYAIGEKTVVLYRKIGAQWQVQPPLKVDEKITQGVLLAGDHSLLLVLNGHRVEQWFEVVTENGRAWQRTRDYQVQAAPISRLLVDPTQKYFYVQQGELLQSFYALNTEPMAYLSLNTDSPNWLSVQPDGKTLLFATKHHWRWITPEWGYPSIKWSNLFRPVWYENHLKAAHIWQSYASDGGQETKFGVMPLIFGTFKATFVALIFAVPLALGGAIYTAYFMSSQVRRWVKPTIELMEALPTVILGFLAAVWLAPLLEQNVLGILLFLMLAPFAMAIMGALWSVFLRHWHGNLARGWHLLLLMPWIFFVLKLSLWGGHLLESTWFGGDVHKTLFEQLGWGFEQRNALVIGMTLGFAVIPTIFTLAEDAIYSVPRHLVQSSMALGGTHWQTLRFVVLPMASSGLFSAVMMGLGRAIGETMIVMMATGNTPIMEWNLFSGLRSLSATIAIEMPKSNVGSDHFHMLFLGAFLLLIFTFVINTIAELIRQRLREKYQTL